MNLDDLKRDIDEFKASPIFDDVEYGIALEKLEQLIECADNDESLAVAVNYQDFYLPSMFPDYNKINIL